MKHWIMPVVSAALVLCSMVALAEEQSVTETEYQMAIQSFGVDADAAETAAHQAFKLSAQNQQRREDDTLVRIPPDFLDGAPW